MELALKERQFGRQMQLCHFHLQHYVEQPRKPHRKKLGQKFYLETILLMICITLFPSLVFLNTQYLFM